MPHTQLGARTGIFNRAVYDNGDLLRLAYKTLRWRRRCRRAEQVCEKPKGRSRIPGDVACLFASTNSFEKHPHSLIALTTQVQPTVAHSISSHPSTSIIPSQPMACWTYAKLQVSPGSRRTSLERSRHHLTTIRRLKRRVDGVTTYDCNVPRAKVVREATGT